jgi:WD40 repeat protein
VVRLWDIEAGKEIWHSDALPSVVNSVAVSPTGEHAISGGADGRIRLWDLRQCCRVGNFGGHRGPITCVVFSPDGQRFISTSDDRTARLWDIATGTQIACQKHDAPVSAAAFSPDGTCALTGARSVHVWWMLD